MSAPRSRIRIASCVAYDTNIIRKNDSMASLFGISICTDTYTPVLQFNYNTDKYGVTVSVSVQYMIPQSKEVSRNWTTLRIHTY